MKRNLTEEEIAERERKYEEATDSIDYDNFDLSTTTFDELKHLLTLGMYIDELKNEIIYFIDKKEKEGKTVEETFNEFYELSMKREAARIERDKAKDIPLTYKSFKEIMSGIKDENHRKMVADYIDLCELNDQSLEKTYSDIIKMIDKLEKLSQE